ncbi:hypothetical protein ACFLYU_03610 [Candidatus Dependentiae bacterium]
MYEYKQFHVWLVIIPFWVLHIFGAPSLLSSLSGYDIFSFKKDPMLVNVFGVTDPCEEDDMSEIADNGQFDIEHLLADKNSSNKCLKSFMKRLRKLKKRYSQDIIVCDNRIDRMKKFAGYLRDKDLNVEDRAWVTVA